MSGGGGGTSTTVQKADPWWGAQPYLQDVYSMSQHAAKNTSTDPYGGNFVTQANDTQKGLVDKLMGLSGSAQANDTSAYNLAKGTASGDYLMNPALPASLDAQMRPVAEKARDIMLPAISSQAQSQGAYGGSRHALAQRYAFKDTQQAIADSTAKQVADNYGRERQIQTYGTPGLIQAANAQMMLPTQLQGQAGDLAYSIEDLKTQQQLRAFEDELNRYWRRVNPYVAALGGIGTPGGTTNSSTTGAGGSQAAGIAMGAMGGAASGAMAGAALAPASMGTSIPIGALIGALLGGGAGAIR